MNAANDGDNYYSLEGAPEMEAPAAPAAPEMEAPAAPAVEAPAAPAIEAPAGPMGMEQGPMGMELAPMEQHSEEEAEEAEEAEAEAAEAEAVEPAEPVDLSDVIDRINPYNRKQIALAFATLIGAFGGFPEPPRQFTELARNEWFRWLMVAILVFQGAGGQDPRLAAVVTAIGYVHINFLKEDNFLYNFIIYFFTLVILNKI